MAWFLIGGDLLGVTKNVLLILALSPIKAISPLVKAPVVVSMCVCLCVLVCVYMLFCVFVCVCVNLYAHTHSCVFVCSRQSVCKIKIYFSFASSPNLCDPVRWPVAGRGPEVEKHCCWVPLPQGLCMGLLQQHS